MRCFPKVASKTIHKPFKYGKINTLLSCQDNTDYLEYLFMIKLIVPASVNIPSLKAADENSHHTFLFTTVIPFKFKN